MMRTVMMAILGLSLVACEGRSPTEPDRLESRPLASLTGEWSGEIAQAFFESVIGRIGFDDRAAACATEAIREQLGSETVAIAMSIEGGESPNPLQVSAGASDLGSCWDGEIVVHDGGSFRRITGSVVCSFSLPIDVSCGELGAIRIRAVDGPAYLSGSQGADDLLVVVLEHSFVAVSLEGVPGEDGTGHLAQTNASLEIELRRTE